MLVQRSTEFSTPLLYTGTYKGRFISSFSDIIPKAWLLEVKIEWFVVGELNMFLNWYMVDHWRWIWIYSLDHIFDAAYI